MKKSGMIGAILLLATEPANLLIWGGLLIVCTGMVLAAEGERQKARPGRAGDTAGRRESAKRLSHADTLSIPQNGGKENVHGTAGDPGADRYPVLADRV